MTSNFSLVTIQNNIKANEQTTLTDLFKGLKNQTLQSKEAMQKVSQLSKSCRMELVIKYRLFRFGEGKITHSDQEIIQLIQQNPYSEHFLDAIQWCHMPLDAEPQNVVHITEQKFDKIGITPKHRIKRSIQGTGPRKKVKTQINTNFDRI